MSKRIKNHRRGSVIEQRRDLINTTPPTKPAYIPMFTRAQIMEHAEHVMELVGPHIIDKGINAREALLLIAHGIACCIMGDSKDVPTTDIIIVAHAIYLLWYLDEITPPANYPYSLEQIQAAMGISPDPEVDAWGKQMMKLRLLPYDKYLKTPHWAEKRKGALERAGSRCQVCNAEDVRLNVHHRTYARLGFEMDQDLTVLCDECHGIFHGHGKLAEREW